jgi:hypothetical protein
MKVVLCPCCHRHVKAHDVRCPFCDVAMPVLVRTRVAAAAVVGFGLGLALGACSSSSTPSEGKDAGDDSNVSPMSDGGYGLAEDASPDGFNQGSDAGDAQPDVEAVYGGPPDADDSGPMASDAYGVPADADAEPVGTGSGAYAPPPEWDAGSGPEGA